MTWNSSLYHLDCCPFSFTFLCCGGFIKAVQWRVCKLSRRERNKGFAVCFCARGRVCTIVHTRALVCVSMSYPLRSSLSSAATLRNSASISSSSCKTKTKTDTTKKGLIWTTERSQCVHMWHYWNLMAAGQEAERWRQNNKTNTFFH